MSPSKDASNWPSRTILITGAGGGLGRAVAHRCGELGARVILCDQSEAALTPLYDEIEALAGVEPAMLPLDFREADAESIAACGPLIQGFSGLLDAIVHCAAALGTMTPLSQYSAKTWEQVLRVNLTVPMLLTQTCLPLLRRETTNSTVIFTVDPRVKAYWGAYGISKHAVEALAAMFADETDHDRDTNDEPHVRFYAVNPGKMRTQLRRKAFPGEASDTVPDPTVKVSAFVDLIDGTYNDANKQSPDNGGFIDLESLGS